MRQKKKEVEHHGLLATASQTWYIVVVKKGRLSPLLYLYIAKKTAISTDQIREREIDMEKGERERDLGKK